MNRPSSYRLLSIAALTLLLSACQPPQSDKHTDSTATTDKDSKDTASSDQSAVDIEKLKQAQNTPNLSLPASGPALPDFASINDVSTKKQAFFAFLQPMIEQENQHLTEMRQHFGKLQDLLSKQGQLHPQDQQWLTKTARLYRADADTAQQQLALLQAKVDRIPAALVKAQAANESAWGTSRFAREANNLFGQWCFQPGCGIAPLHRGADETHEVQAFSSVAAGLRSYFTNLNGNKSYASLRQIRRCLNSNNDQPSGRALAAGLTNYSARGGHYVEELQAMIRINKLEPWQAEWWGENNPKHACYPLVQVEVDHPDPVVVAAVKLASSAISSSAASLSVASSELQSSSLASASLPHASTTTTLTADTSSGSILSSTSIEDIPREGAPNTSTLSSATTPANLTSATLGNLASSSSMLSITEVVTDSEPTVIEPTMTHNEVASAATTVAVALQPGTEQLGSATDDDSRQNGISTEPTSTDLVPAVTVVVPAEAPTETPVEASPETPAITADVAPIVITTLVSTSDADTKIDSQPEPKPE